MIFRETSVEDICEIIGRNIIFFAKEDSDIEITEDIDGALLLSFNKRIPTAVNRVKLANIVPIELKTLSLIITYPEGLILRISQVPEIYISNFSYGYDSYKVKNEYGNNVPIYYIQTQNIIIKFDLDRSIYKQTSFEPGKPIARLYFVSLPTMISVSPHIYFFKDNVLYEQNLIKNTSK